MSPRFSFNYLELPVLRIPHLHVLLPSPRLLVQLLKIIRSSDVIVFVPCYSVFDAMIMFLGKIVGRPLIAVFQNPPLIEGLKAHNVAFSCLLKTLGNRALSACQVLNPHHYRVLRKLGVKAKIRIIPQGVDVRRFTYSQALHRHRSFRILFVGRLCKQKGVDRLLEIVKEVNKRSSLSGNVQFMIAGPVDTEALSILRELCRERNVIYFGDIKYDEMPSIYSEGDVLILPSRYEGGFPLTALEAQAAGLPLVLSDLPEVRWIYDKVPNMHVIRLAPQDNLQAFVEAVMEFYNEWLKGEQCYAELREKCKENAAKFDWDNIVGDINVLILDSLRWRCRHG
jgi:glycosyltransferase involved in cell wall biosynthesis